MKTQVDDEEIGNQLIERLIVTPFNLGGVISGIILFILYVVIAQWSYFFVIPPQSNAVFWFPSGITCALFMIGRWRPQIWPYWLGGVFFGELLIANFHKVPLITGIFWSVANVILCLFTTFLARLFMKAHFDFCNIKNILSFAITVPIAVIPGGLVAAYGNKLGFENVHFLTDAINWASSDALGIILGAPVLLAWVSKGHKTTGSFKEGVVLTILLGLFSLVILFYSQQSFINSTYFSFLIFFVAWAAIRFGPKGTSLALVVMDIVEVWVTIKGEGAFAYAHLSYQTRLLTIQCLVANIAILMLLLSAAIEEQKTARIHAEEALKLRDDFLSVASHELKTPLTSLMMQVQFLNHYISQDKLTTLPKEKLVNLAQISEREIKRFANLVNDLLDVSRISTGHLNLNLQSSDLVELVKETVHRFQGELEKNHCPIRISGENHIKGRWDKLRIEQIFTNLLSNAIKYGAGKPIEILSEQIENIARITITDHGIGISQEDQSRIFKRFERAVSINQFGGLGLGLFIADQIAEAHGGKVKVQSEIGEGSSFIVEIPLLPELT